MEEHRPEAQLPSIDDRRDPKPDLNDPVLQKFLREAAIDWAMRASPRDLAWMYNQIAYREFRKKKSHKKATIGSQSRKRKLYERP